MKTTVTLEGKEYNYDEIPEGLREKYKGFLEEVEMHKVELEKSNPHSSFSYKVVANIILFVVIGLAGLSFFSNVSTIISIKGLWLAIYLSTLTLVLVVIFFPYITKQAKFPFSGSMLKKIGGVTVGSLGMAVLCAFAIFSGAPTLFHHLNKANGELIVTVSDKQDGYRKGKCNPRLIIKEFSWFLSDHICLDNDAYNQINIKRKITIKGFVSPYGVESRELSWK